MYVSVEIANVISERDCSISTRTAALPVSEREMSSVSTNLSNHPSTIPSSSVTFQRVKAPSTHCNTCNLSTAKYARPCDEEWRFTPAVGGCSHPMSSSRGRLKTSPRRRGFSSVATNIYFCGMMKYQNKLNQLLLNC